MDSFNVLEVTAVGVPKCYNRVGVVPHSMYHLLTDPRVSKERIDYRTGDTLKVNGIGYYSSFPWYWRLAARFRHLYPTKGD